MIMTVPINTEGLEDAKVGDYYERVIRNEAGVKREKLKVTNIFGGFIHLQLQSEKVINFEQPTKPKQ